MSDASSWDDVSGGVSQAACCDSGQAAKKDYVVQRPCGSSRRGILNRQHNAPRVDRYYRRLVGVVMAILIWPDRRAKVLIVQNYPTDLPL